MKVKNTYIVKRPNTVYKQKDILFECENGEWYLQYSILMQEWVIQLEKITNEQALELIE